MTRLPDWRERLLAYVASISAEPFRPGRHDCIILAAGGRQALTGVDLMENWRGRYRSVEDGLELARQQGCENPFEWVVQGLEEVPAAFAQVGDIALLDGTNGMPGLGIVAGEHVYTVGLRRLEIAQLTDVRRAWRL